MYRTKPLVPFWDNEQVHLRGKGDSNQDSDVELIEEFNPDYVKESNHVGYVKLPALCGEMVASKQSVLPHFDKEEVCDDCVEVAESEGIRITEFVKH